jgi:mono/diheme cytochrome c family protein
MKKLLIIVCLVATVSSVVITSCVSRKSEPITQKSFVPATTRIAHGESVYMMHCQKCHPAGEGGLGPSITANPAPQFIKRFQMRHGIGVMPSFKQDEISKQDLRDISKYLYAWKHY